MKPEKIIAGVLTMSFYVVLCSIVMHKKDNNERPRSRMIKSVRAWLDSPLGMYRIIELNDPTCPFHLERIRNSQNKGDEVLMIRVVEGPIADRDRQLCHNYRLPGRIFTKGIVSRTPGEKKFDFVEIS
ncbi:MAG: hypothetical protein SCM96_02265 [Acidobacteriota bacterium]|nr:hypothetical protein [Acidobacteriota bacterium]